MAVHNRLHHVEGEVFSFEPDSANAGGFSHGREIRILEPGPEGKEPGGFLLSEAESAVMGYDDLYREIEFGEAKGRRPSA
jgi:hypothetical protein